MSINRDITEEVPYVLSNPVATIAYAANGISYDIAVNGMPFFLASSDSTPYRRETAQYRKDQVDQTTEAGEQTLTGWWLRSQASFHSGSGIKYYDPVTLTGNDRYRFADSKGVNVWTKGQVTLLPDSTSGHQITGTIGTNGRTKQHVRSIKWSGTNGVLVLDDYDVDKINSSGTVTHFIDYNAGAGVYPVYSVCDDGTNAYWVTNATAGGTTKLTVFGKPLTGSSASTADEFKVFDNSQIISNATIEYIKDRLVLCADNKVYECAPAAASTPTLLYTHPSTTHTYTSITASGPAIYLAGYNGIQSTIQRFAISSTGAMPTLTSAIVAAELPVGEVVHKIYYYLGYVMIGTNKGIRVSKVLDDGSLVYGPLIVETSQPVYDFAARDRYVWAATGVDGSPGLIRIDLGNELDDLVFAWANDVYYPDSTSRTTTGCAFLGDSSQLAYTSANNGSTDGNVYITSATVLISSGYIKTGRIRFSTLEPKVFKFLKALADNSNGSILITSISSSNNEYTIGTFGEDDPVLEVATSSPAGAQEYLSFKFTLTRSATDTTAGPIFSGYQLKALPSIKRQRLMQFALGCYDHHTDTYGNQVGYEGMAYDTLAALEALEDNADTVRVEDFRINESFLGLIEGIQFVNPTPTDKVNTGFGGVILLTIRKL